MLEHADLKLEGSVLWSRGQRVAVRFSQALSNEVLEAALGPSLRMLAPSRYEGQRFKPISDQFDEEA